MKAVTGSPGSGFVCVVMCMCVCSFHAVSYFLCDLWVTPLHVQGIACSNSFMTAAKCWVCCAESLSCVRLFATPWTVARQAPLSMAILQARILEWVAMPSSRGSSQPRSPALQADSLLSEPPGKPMILLVSTE